MQIQSLSLAENRLQKARARDAVRQIDIKRKRMEINHYRAVVVVVVVTAVAAIT